MPKRDLSTRRPSLLEPLQSGSRRGRFVVIKAEGREKLIRSHLASCRIDPAALWQRQAVSPQHFGHLLCLSRARRPVVIRSGVFRSLQRECQLAPPCRADGMARASQMANHPANFKPAVRQSRGRPGAQEEAAEAAPLDRGRPARRLLAFAASSAALVRISSPAITLTRLSRGAASSSRSSCATRARR